MAENRSIALVTCAGYADLHEEDRAVIAPLARRGVTALPAVWDDPDVDWTSFDLSVIRSTWDYPNRRDEFLAWAASVPSLANPADVLSWNTDKRYLNELAQAGLPVVETTWFGPGDDADLSRFATGEVVIKPSVGAGSVGVGRYDLGDADQRRLATAHVLRLQRGGSTAMVQPYLHAIDEEGETALLFFGGEFSHAIGKAAILSGPYEAVDGLFVPTTITPRMPSDAQLGVAEAVLKAVPGGPDRLTYARVDVLSGPDETPVLLELELCEPNVFLSKGDGSAAERLADAIAAATTTAAQPSGDEGE